MKLAKNNTEILNYINPFYFITIEQILEKPFNDYKNLITHLPAINGISNNIIPAFQSAIAAPNLTRAKISSLEEEEIFFPKNTSYINEFNLFKVIAFKGNELENTYTPLKKHFLKLSDEEKRYLGYIDLNKILLNSIIDPYKEKNISESSEKLTIQTIKDINILYQEIKTINNFRETTQFNIAQFLKYLKALDGSFETINLNSIIKNPEYKKDIEKLSYNNGFLIDIEKFLNASKKATKKEINTGKDIGNMSINEIKKLINQKEYSFLQNIIDIDQLKEHIFNFQTKENLIQVNKNDYIQYKNKKSIKNESNEQNEKIDEMLFYINQSLFKLSFFDPKSIKNFIENKKPLEFSKLGNLNLEKFSHLYSMYDKIENNILQLAEENKNDPLAATATLLTAKKYIDKTEAFFSKTVYKDSDILLCEFIRNLGFQIMNKYIDRSKCEVIRHDGPIGFENFERIQTFFSPMQGKILFQGKQAVSAPTGSGKSKTFQSLASCKNIFDLFNTNPLISKFYLPKDKDSKQIIFFRFNNTGEMKQKHNDHIKLSGFETSLKQLGLIFDEVGEFITKGLAGEIHLISDEIFANAGSEAVQSYLDKAMKLKELLSQDKVSITFIEHNKDTKNTISDTHIIFEGPIITVDKEHKNIQIDEKYLTPNTIDINNENKDLIETYLEKYDKERHDASTKITFYFKIDHTRKCLRKVSEAEFNKSNPKQPQNYLQIDYLPTVSEIENDFSKPECNIVQCINYDNNKREISFTHIIKEININNKKALIILPIKPLLDLKNNKIELTVPENSPYFFCNDLVLMCNMVKQISRNHNSFSPVLYNSPDIKRIIEQINFRHNEEQIRIEAEQERKANQEAQEQQNS